MFLNVKPDRKITFSISPETNLCFHTANGSSFQSRVTEKEEALLPSAVLTRGGRGP